MKKIFLSVTIVLASISLPACRVGFSHTYVGSTDALPVHAVDNNDATASGSYVVGLNKSAVTTENDNVAKSESAITCQTLPLWDETPMDNGNDNVAEITVYHPVPTVNSGAAVVICPGGGYEMLAMDHEGHQIANWLASNGITSVVLKYRLPHGNHLIPATDAREAIRKVRANASAWGVNPSLVGIAGSSAGGHLASTVSTHITDSESHPDFAILFYPVISSDPAITHQGSMNNLLGAKVSDPDMLRCYSNDKQVTPATPPTLLLLSDDDLTVPAVNSTRYYNALKANGVPATMYIFPIGEHGWGFHETFAYSKNVRELMLDWLTRTINNKAGY